MPALASRHAVVLTRVPTYVSEVIGASGAGVDSKLWDQRGHARQRDNDISLRRFAPVGGG
jgi:hypothetical protein